MRFVNCKCVRVENVSAPNGGLKRLYLIKSCQEARKNDLWQYNGTVWLISPSSMRWGGQDFWVCHYTSSGLTTWKCVDRDSWLTIVMSFFDPLFSVCTHVVCNVELSFPLRTNRKFPQKSRGAYCFFNQIFMFNAIVCVRVCVRTGNPINVEVIILNTQSRAFLQQC